MRPPQLPKRRALRLPAVLVAVLAAALLLHASAVAARPPVAAEDEIVPAGVLMFRAAVGMEDQKRAIARNNHEGGLKAYLIPQPEVRQQVDGEVKRTVQNATLNLHYGFSDTWNLALEVPYRHIDQHSTLHTDSSDPAATAAVARYPNDTVSGTGDVRLLSLHRTVFSDHNAFVLGLGVQVPPGSPQREYTGVGTLSTRGPAPAFVGLLHYTRYPMFGRTRFDLRGELRIFRPGRVTGPDGTKVSVVPGNAYEVQAGWGQEFGAVSMALGLGYFHQSPTDVDNNNQQDPVNEMASRLELGYGNLRALETGPVAFPYRLALRYDRTLQGFNTPMHSDLSLSLQTYF